MDGHLIGAGTFLLGPIEIAVIGQPRLPAGCDVILDQPMQPAAAFADEQRPALAAPVIAARLGILHRAVGAQTLVPAPARRHLPPFFVIRPVAANIDHGVDAGRAAQYLAAWPEIALPGKARVRLGKVAPVDGRVMEQLAIAQRQMDIKPPVRPPRLQHRHLMLARCRQPIGQHRPGRA